MRSFWLAIVGVMFVACGGGEEPAKQPEAPKPPPVEAPKPVEAEKAPEKVPFGRVEAILGEPVIVRGEQKISAAVDTAVEAGDRVTTAKKQKIRIVLADKSVLAIGDNTDIKLDALDVDQAKGRKGSLTVAFGKFWMQVEKWAGQGESSWEIATPNAVAGVRGTTLWGDTKVDAICALEGEVEVRSVKNEKLKPAALTAGKCASKLSKGKLAPLSPKPKQVQGFLKEVLISEAK